MHPKPIDIDDNIMLDENSSPNNNNNNGKARNSVGEKQHGVGANSSAVKDEAPNLIQLDGWESLLITFFSVIRVSCYQTLLTFPTSFPAIMWALTKYFRFLSHSDDTHDDDIIFEDFARLRLKGGETEA